MTNVHTVPEPAIRYAGAREAFIALYEAAGALMETLDTDPDTRALASIEDPCRALQGALDKAAPAYGQALVARAEGRTIRASDPPGIPWEKIDAPDATEKHPAVLLVERFCSEMGYTAPELLPERLGELFDDARAYLKGEDEETGGQ